MMSLKEIVEIIQESEDLHPTDQTYKAVVVVRNKFNNSNIPGEVILTIHVPQKLSHLNKEDITPTMKVFEIIEESTVMVNIIEM